MGFDERFIVQGFSKALTPGGVTIELIKDARTLGPVLTFIKNDGNKFVLDMFTFFHGGVYFLFRIRNVTYELVDLVV